MHPLRPAPVISWALAGAIGLAVVGCGASSTSATTPSGAGTKATPATRTDISVGNSSLGPVLTDRAGLTLYYFRPEQGSKLLCDSGACVSTWPLVTVGGSPTGAAGLSDRLTTVSAPNGQTEAVYNGWPLHTYSGDKSPGDTRGQGIGGQWFVATPSLSPSGGSASASPSASSPYGY